MASILKVNTIQDTDGNNIINENANVITIGASGDTITVPAGATVSGFTSAGIDDNATSVAITIDSNENVGIGTTSPDTLLSLEKNNAPIIQFKDTSGATDEKIWRVNGLNDAYRIQTWNDALNSNQVAYQVMRSGVDVTDHRFNTEDSERMRLTSTGLGIGSSSPLAKIHIRSSNTSITPNPNADELFLENTGNCGLTIATGTGDIGTIFFADSGDHARGRIRYDQSTDKMEFGTAGGSEKVVIDSSGNVGIGTASIAQKLHVNGVTKTAGLQSIHSQKSFIASSNSNNYTLEIESTSSNPLSQYITEVAFTASSPDNSSAKFFQMLDNTTTRVNINSDGDLQNHDNSYGGISDERIKQDIVDASSQWEDIKNIRIRKYKKKHDVIQYGEENAPIELGVISQELETVSPGLVKEDKADKSHAELHEDFTGDNPQNVKYVKYSILYMKSVKALQEAMERIETLEAEVTALKNQP